MDLKEILSVSGRSGLFKVVAQTKNGAIVESLIDKKRFPVFTTDKISSLSDISVFCEDDDMPLKEVLKRIYDKEQAQKVNVALDNGSALKSYFETVMPEYDKERVYVSDMKKIIGWYNLLLENNILDFTESPEEAIAEPAGDDSEEETTKEA